jgi:Uma2 family endonuclease
MTSPAKKPATYADIEALPPHVTGQILFGSLYTHPRPVTRHVTCVHRLDAVLTNTYEFDGDEPGSWIFLPQEELHLGPHVIVPDLSGWRVDRLPPDYLESKFIEIPPDWICEVLSPSTEDIDKSEKRRIYATYGVGHLWYIDPRPRILEVFARQDRDWLLLNTFTEHDDVCAPPFADLTFPLKRLWPQARRVEPRGET